MSEQTAGSGDGGEAGAGTAGAVDGGTGAGPAPEGAGGTSQGVDASAGGGSTDSGPGPSAAPVDWRESLSEELRGAPALRDVDSVEALATQLINAQGLIGNSIRIPSEHASDEERANFRKTLLDKVPGMAELQSDDPEAFRAAMQQMGAPEDAKGYKLPEFDGEGMEPVDGFNEWAAEASLTQSQFETLARRFTETQQGVVEERMAAHNADMEALHREWGYAFEERVAAATGAAKLLGAPADFVEALEGNKVPAPWVRFFAGMSEKFSEADIGQERNEGERRMTPAEAQAQLDEIMGNKDHIYWSRDAGPAKDRAVAQVMKLRTMAMGKGGADVAVSLGQMDELG